MSEIKEYRRSLVVSPKASSQFNQFLPTKEKQSGYVPVPVHRTRPNRNSDNRRSWASPQFTDEDGSFSSELGTQRSMSATHISWPSWYESSDSEADHPDPDLVLDDLASRRFHSSSVVTPTNFALPMTSVKCTGMPQTTRPKGMVDSVPQATLTYLSDESRPPQKAAGRPESTDIHTYDDSEEDDNEIGNADPVQDDFYARKLGMTGQPPATVHYDTFLPKFWTPEEDVHVKKIRLGSQRRPWYREMQGFSQKKSDSFSVDSESDVVHQHHVFSRSQSEPPTSHPHTSETSTQSRLSSTPSPSAQPLMLAQQNSEAPRFHLPDFWPRPDPTSGPRLIKCEKRPLLGRENANDPYNVPEDIIPDLENDDMFTRRTSAFHSCTDLARLKYGGLFSLHRKPESDIRVVTQPDHDQSVYPDIERDDVISRRVQLQSTQRPLSGAPDIYHPVPIPEFSVLPTKLQAKVCTQCPPTCLDPQVLRKQKGYDHVKSDDMLVRKLGMVHVQDGQSLTEVCQISVATQTGPSVPSFCSKEDQQKWEAIREASRVRYKKKLMVERLMQKKSESDRSSSISEIPIEAVASEVNFEELQKMRSRIRENEDKWQDDLSKWKNRRRSVNSDIVKKKEEREQIEVLTGGSDTKKSKTFKEMEEERENREPGYRNRFSFYSTSEDVFEEPTPKTRTINRSYTIDTPYTSMNRSLPSLIDEPDAGSLASVSKDSPASPIQSNTGNTLNTNQKQTSTFSSHSLLDDPVPTSVTKKPSRPEPTRTSQLSSNSSMFSRPSLETNINSKPDNKSSSFVGPAPGTRNSYSRVEEDQKQTSLYRPDPSETKQPVVSRVSASLPRNYQKTDSTRITSFVAPRPFGTQSTRVSSLPRPYMVDDKEQNGKTVSTRTSYSSSMHADKPSFQTGSVQSSNGKQEENQAVSAARISSSITPIGRVSPQPKTQSYSDMRVSLNQKPNSSRDFGFQSNWDSTGAHVKSIQPGSPAELCQLQVGDEIMAVNGNKVTDMNYNQWKKCMDEALQQGSLLMDIRRHGKSNWDRDLPSLPFTSHKTINLTSPGPLGSPEPYVSTSLDFTSRSMDPTVKTLNVSGSPVNSLTSFGINGGNLEQKVTLRNKGGSETTSDVPVQSPSVPSTRSPWDPEEERKRQEKWQKEQERQLREKYRRDQEKMEEEFKKAQQEAVKQGTKQYEEDVKRLELQREASRLAAKEEEERRKREEEKKKMEQEEERRQLEQQKRLDERRYQESYQRPQEYEVGSDYTNTFPELSYSHRLKSKSTPELDEMERTDIKGVYSRHRGLASWLLEEELRRKKNPQILRQQAASELELERRNILSAMRYRNPEKAGLGESKDKKEPITPTEVDRQQIIQDMKKKTSLLTDNSWIRQSASTNNQNKEPVNVPMRRGESLDNLDTKPSSWRSSWTPDSTSTSIPDYSRPPRSSLSGSSYGSGNTVTTTLPASQLVRSNKPSSFPSPSSSTTGTLPENQSSSKNRSVSGKKICTSCDMPLGKGAAMIIESLGLCFHLQCFKCIQCKCDLGGSENGAEVRIRNKQLFCNSCYMRVKTAQPTAM
ncbi:LIM domain only protein 7 isoform X2 [Trichomycterus rosablanca]|uniref:LIM domain only protein 7 isoform X2 n=1 Tax=Trichomycterus rosablanca TaxID=2290929 RepID=UPI002F3533CE